MIEELHSHYVRTARAKGVPEGAVVWHHAFRNALLPIVTQVAMGYWASSSAASSSSKRSSSWPGG